MMRKHITRDEKEVELLCVPWFPQQEESYYCFPYSLWMVLEFFRNVYKNDIIKNKIPKFDVEELAKICKTDKNSGTRINEQLLKELNNKIEPLNFELKREASFDDIKQHLKNKIPCIVLYDCGYFLYRSPSKVGHAGVVLSLSEEDIFLNNPWLGAEVGLNKLEFNDAWEIEYKNVIFVKPKYQTKLNDKNAN